MLSSTNAKKWSPHSLDIGLSHMATNRYLANHARQEAITRSTTSSSTGISPPVSWRLRWPITQPRSPPTAAQASLKVRWGRSGVGEYLG
jgi:hypothetical protein